MNFTQDVYIWAGLGLLLLASEMFSGTFHLLFFGVSAIIVAGLSAFGLSNFPSQLGLFAILSILSFFMIKKKFTKQKSTGFQSDIHQKIQLTADIPTHGEASIQYQGSPWTAVNTSDQVLLKGSKVKIEKTEGNKIFVKPE